MVPAPRSTHRHRAGLLLATLALTAPALAACADDEGGSATDGATPSAPTPSEAAPTPTPTPSSEPSGDGEDGEDGEDGATSGMIAPVYFVGQTPSGQRLFREYLPVGDEDAVSDALALAASGDSLDPDYTSLLPSGVPTATTGDGLIQVTLPDASWATRPEEMTPRQAKLAVQQLVYTAQETLQEKIPVAFVLDGSVSPVLGIDAPEGIRAAKQLNVLALVNLDSPAQGAQVSQTFTATGLASSFEATVPWELRDAQGSVVKDGFATAEGWMDRLYPFSTEVDVSDLAPGDYVFAAMTDDPSSGEGGGPTEDTKAVTVQ